MTITEVSVNGESRAGRGEQRRLVALGQLHLNPGVPDTNFDAMTRLASYVCGTMGAAINILEADHQWTAAGFPCTLPDTPLSDSMCAISMRNPDISYTPDATQDPRWEDNPFVTGIIDNLRTYAAAPLVLPSGDVMGTVCVFDRSVRPLRREQLERLRDIADQVTLMLQLQGAINNLDRVATRDHLTGLPNTALFEHSLDHALALFRRGGPTPSVLFLDLDRFKPVNDQYGHATGDELLRAVTARLSGTMRGANILARRSGDEFLVLAEGHDGMGAPALVERVRECFEAPFVLVTATVEIGVSVGAATALPADTTATLLHRADELMYRDKYRRRMGDERPIDGAGCAA